MLDSPNVRLEGGSRLAKGGEPPHDPDQPLVSVITVSLNSEGSIEKTIRSVIDQTYRNIEYLVIDGGSTDGTLDIIRENENYIAYWLSEPDRGIYDAMNKGIVLCRGEIIGIINSDDWYLPDAIEQVVKAYREHRDVDVFFGDLLTVDRDGGHVEEIKGSLESITSDMTLNHPTVFITGETFARNPFRMDLKIVADYELMLRLYLAGAKFHYLGVPMACFTRGGKSYNHRLRFSELYDLKKEYHLINGREHAILSILLPLKILDARFEEFLKGRNYFGDPDRAFLGCYRKTKGFLKNMLRLP